MPVYNERTTIGSAVERVLAAGLSSFELVVVDDGSTDGTREWLRTQGWPAEVRLVLHERNAGKGAAVRTGLRHADGRYATIMDADVEYDPRSIRSLLEPMRAGEAEAVYGVRGFDAVSAYSFWYVMGNRTVTMTMNVLFNTWLSDIMTCQKLLPTALWRSLALRERGFAFEAEVTAQLARAGVRIYEVPVPYRARSRSDGKKLTGLDGLRVLRTLVRCRLDPRPPLRR
jgi:dolichol-phosphate hexosyltransferase